MTDTKRVVVIDESIPQPWRKFIVALRDERDALSAKLETVEAQRDAAQFALSTARYEALEEAISAVGKHLETPIDHDDGLYQRGVKDAISAIRALKSQGPE